MAKLTLVRIWRVVFSLALAAGLSLISSVVQGARQDWPSGREIVDHINVRDEGEAVSRTLRIELIDRRGKKRVRLTQTFRKYYGTEKRTVIFYQSPRNVKGTGFLTIDYPRADQEDDQWLYLPALRKVRRISAANRGDYFLGTDFTYEDIKKETKVSLEDYTWKTMGEEMVDGYHCFVVEGIPVTPKIAEELGYGRLLARVDDASWMVRKAEFWDIRGNPLKTNMFRDIRQVQDIWTAHQFESQNHKTGHRTVFTFSNVNYATPIEDDLFTQRSLRRGR